jgi:DNA-binding transcriptional MerR regulator
MPNTTLASPINAHYEDEFIDGYRAPVACEVAQITYRQLDYWARHNVVEPSLVAAAGSGSQRRYSFEDLVELRLVAEMVSIFELREARRALAVYRAARAHRSEFYLITDPLLGWDAVDFDEIDLDGVMVATVVSVDWVRSTVRQKLARLDDAAKRQRHLLPV